MRRSGPLAVDSALAQGYDGGVQVDQMSPTGPKASPKTVQTDMSATGNCVDPGRGKPYTGDAEMGASRTWKVPTPRKHTVQVQHAMHSGRVRITVDGDTIFEQSSREALWETGFDHEFTIEDLLCQLRIRFSYGSPDPAYELWVNG